MKAKCTLVLVLAFTCCLPISAGAEILAMLNYESKPDDSLKDLKMPFGAQGRKEGLAVIDVDPNSATFGKILMDIPLPSDLVAHHIFYNRDATKIYMTSLGKPEIRVINMTEFPYRVKVLEIPECLVSEDVIFSEDNKTWYATCMGSNVIVVGDAVNDTVSAIVDSPTPYPHGIAIDSDIDRILVTNTVRASDLADPGEMIGVLEASSNKNLGSFKVADEPSPSGVAPVEVVFVPSSNPPVAYVTNMNGGTLWTAKWNENSETFDAAEAFDFEPLGVGVPLEIYFSADGERMYVTTANPGHLHIFELGKDKTTPKLVKTLPTGEGAHHVAFSKDGKLAWVQNSFINLPGMSEGSITVVDLEKLEVIDTIDTFIENGFNPNCIVLLPEWNDPMGH